MTNARGLACTAQYTASASPAHEPTNLCYEDDFLPPCLPRHWFLPATGSYPPPPRSEALPLHLFYCGRPQRLPYYHRGSTNTTFVDSRWMIPHPLPQGSLARLFTNRHHDDHPPRPAHSSYTSPPPSKALPSHLSDCRRPKLVPHHYRGSMNTMFVDWRRLHLAIHAICALPAMSFGHGMYLRLPCHHREPTNIVFVDLREPSSPLCIALLVAPRPHQSPQRLAHEPMSTRDSDDLERPSMTRPRFLHASHTRLEGSCILPCLA
ncbi:hypothetical protein C0995_004981 [Termitomyces sp. Mi166|nr:hypothetical protein C0995_004981 [Termitomyces sp. Mi166\